MNLTQEQKVVSEERRGVGAKPGHDLAVFEIVDHGLRFERLVREGEKFEVKRKGLFASTPEYASYAVNMNRNLRFVFTDRFDHMTAGHSFDLTFTLRFHVDDPSVITQRMSDDPLKMLRDEIKRTLGGAVSKTRWEEISRSKLQENFAALANQVYSRHQEELEDFAAGLGIGIKGIDVSLGMTAEDAAPVAAITKKERTVLLAKTEDELAAHARERAKANESAQIEIDISLADKRQTLARTKQMNEHELKALQSQSKVMESGTDAFITAIQNIAGETRTPETLARSVEAVGRLFQVARAAGSQGQGRSVEGGGIGTNHLLQTGSQNHGLELVLNEVLNEFGPRSAQGAAHRRLLAAILHWVAESLLGADSDSAAVEHYRLALTDPPDDLTPGQYLLLRRLLDIDELRNKMS